VVQRVARRRHAGSVISILVSRSTTSPCTVSATIHPRLRRNGSLRHGNHDKLRLRETLTSDIYRKSSRTRSSLIPIASSSPRSVRRMRSRVKQSVHILYLQRAGNLSRRSCPSLLAIGTWSSALIGTGAGLNSLLIRAYKSPTLALEFVKSLNANPA
jgi:hypothetical protein